MLNLNWQAPALEVDEAVILTVPANLVLYGVARGGNLVLTNRRLIFQPNSFEAWLRMKPRSWTRDSITAVGVARRGANLFGGALKRRLRLSLGDSGVLRFVVPRADETASQIAGLLRLTET